MVYAMGRDADTLNIQIPKILMPKDQPLKKIGRILEPITQLAKGLVAITKPRPC